MIKVSVIIPVYNVEEFLEQCLDSVCAQTLQEIEIICVDDGSTDNSPAILQKYAEKDPRVQIITQKNKGVSASRNVGFSHSKGEYVIFWDSDDFFEKDALELLYNKCKKEDADVGVCAVNRYNNISKELLLSNVFFNPKRIPKETFEPMENQPYLFCFTGNHVWNKLIRRKLLIDKQITFYNITVEDVCFTALVLLHANRITTINKPLINYRINISGSLSTGCGPKNMYFAFIQLMEDLRKTNKMTPDLWKSYYNRVVPSLLATLRRHINLKDYEDAFNFIKKEAIETLQLDRYLEPGYAYEDNIRTLSGIEEKNAGDYAVWLHSQMGTEFMQRENSILRKAKEVKSLKDKKSKLEKEKEIQAAKLKTKSLELKAAQAEKKKLEKQLEAKTKQLEKITSSKAYKVMTVLWKIRKMF